MLKLTSHHLSVAWTELILYLVNMHIYAYIISSRGLADRPNADDSDKWNFFFRTDILDQKQYAEQTLPVINVKCRKQMSLFIHVCLFLQKT